MNAEFDRVKTALETAAAKQSGQDRMDTQTLIAILEDKRAEVMAHEEAGYFIHDWQEMRDQVRELIHEMKIRRRFGHDVAKLQRSIEGRIAHIRRTNPGNAARLERLLAIH